MPESEPESRSLIGQAALVTCFARRGAGISARHHQNHGRNLSARIRSEPQRVRPGTDQNRSTWQPDPSRRSGTRDRSSAGRRGWHAQAPSSEDRQPRQFCRCARHVAPRQPFGPGTSGPTSGSCALLHAGTVLARFRACSIATAAGSRRLASSVQQHGGAT